jgi:hypothetical protein
MGREKVQLISVSETADFPGPSFQMKEDGTLMETAGRIKKQSALFPAPVRPKPGGGHESGR